MRGPSQYQTVHAVDVWQTAGFKRVLLSSDVLANVTGLLIAVLGVARLSAHLPEDHSFQDVYLGPRRPAFHLFVAFPALLMTSLVPLLWLLCKPQSYFRHRTATIATVRLLRLLLQVLTLVTPSAAAPLARIVAARAWAQPHKGFRILLVMPMAFYMGHALYLLPWRSAALFQLASTSTVLHWLWRFPCFLLGEQQQQQQWATAAGALSAASVLQGGSAAGPPREVRAVLSCNTLQSHAALLRTALGTPLSEFSRDVCSGASAVQAVQVFCTLICLLVIPVVVSHELERWMRLQYAQGSAPAGMDRASSGASIASSGSSSSSVSASHASIDGSWARSAVAASTGRSIDSLSMAELEQLAGSSLQAGSVCGSCCGMLLLAVLLLVPALWLLTKFLVGVFATNTDCATVLAAAA